MRSSPGSASDFTVTTRWWASSPISPRSGRSSAAACRWLRCWDVASCCRNWRHWARCTRPAPWPEIPVCLAAGIATLTELAEGGAYRHIEMLGKHLDAAFAQHALKSQAQLPRSGPSSGRTSTRRQRCPSPLRRSPRRPSMNITGVIVAGWRAASTCRLRLTRCASSPRLTAPAMSINFWTCWQRAIRSDAIPASTVALPNAPS